MTAGKGMTPASFTDVMDAVGAGMRSIERMQQQRALLTATATAGEGRVTVTVNANGVVVETRFDDDIADLTYDEIATAITEATQQAAAQITDRVAELMAYARREQAQIPMLSELLPGVLDVMRMFPPAPVVSTAPPSESNRVENSPRASAMEFADVQAWNHDVPPDARSEAINHQPW